MNRGPILRNQLLLLAGVPLLILLALEVLVSYRIGIHTANLVFDRWLLNVSYSIAEHVENNNGDLSFDIDDDAVHSFEWSARDHLYFRIDSLTGDLIAGNEAIIPVEVDDQANGPRYGDILIEKEQARVITLPAYAGNTPIFVTVAETLNQREVMGSDLLIEVLASKALLFIAVMLVLVAAFDRGLRPLIMVSKALADRSVRDLEPIDAYSVPREARGLIANTNRLLERLDAGITAREQFIGNIAHQIRTPVAGIKLQAQLAEREQDLNIVREALREISHAADHMSHVNSQLLNLARAEAAYGRGLRSVPISLTELAEKCRNQLMRRASECEVEIILEFDTPSLCVQGELTLLLEMLRNLVENAIVYSQVGAHVWVRVYQENDKAIIEVEDDGPGIPKEHWPRIFERFFRPAQSSGDGCGLGLSIVREIALAHKADVELKDGRNGIGTRFVITFEAQACG